ncbi:MAG: ferritin-like domain-containing protein [Polyangiales bacterium]
MHAVTSLADARRAIDTIVRQGEGSPGHVEGSHYERFTAIRDEYRARLAADPSFRPAYPRRATP